MSPLVLCSGCARHVKAEETACPFCQAALAPSPDSRLCQGPCSGHAAPRLGRAALMAVGATLLCVACERSPAPMYGIAVFDAGGQTVDTGGQADAPSDTPSDAKK